MKPLESEVVREAPLQHQAPVVQEEALSTKKHHHKKAEEEDHKTEDEDDVPPPPAKQPARLTAEALAKLEAETTQKKAPLPVASKHSTRHTSPGLRRIMARGGARKRAEDSEIPSRPFVGRGSASTGAW